VLPAAPRPAPRDARRIRAERPLIRRGAHDSADDVQDQQVLGVKHHPPRASVRKRHNRPNAATGAVTRYPTPRGERARAAIVAPAVATTTPATAARQHPDHADRREAGSPATAHAPQLGQPRDHPGHRELRRPRSAARSRSGAAGANHQRASRVMRRRLPAARRATSQRHHDLPPRAHPPAGRRGPPALTASYVALTIRISATSRCSASPATRAAIAAHSAARSPGPASSRALQRGERLHDLAGAELPRAPAPRLAVARGALRV